MKKGKRTKSTSSSKQINQREPDPWKEIRLKLQPLNKAYRDFRQKRKIAKQKEDRKKLKEEEEQKRREEEAQRLMQLEERKLKKEKKLKEQKERKLKEEEDRKLKEKKIKEDQEERVKQARIYKDRLIKEEKERLDQLERVRKLREEEKGLIEERRLKVERRLKQEKKLEDEKKLKDEEEINLEEKIKLNEKENKRFNGTVKWFNGAVGYGFIQREDKEKDIFVHTSAVNNAGLKYLKEGEKLTFEVEETDRGLSAINLQKTS